MSLRETIGKCCSLCTMSDRVDVISRTILSPLINCHSQMLTNAPVSTWQLTIKMICSIYFREHETTIHTQRTKVITMRYYYQRLIGLLIWSLTSSLRNRWQSSAEIVFYSVSGCFEARWKGGGYRCCWCYRQLTTSFGIYTSLDSKLWALNSSDVQCANHSVSDL